MVVCLRDSADVSAFSHVLKPGFWSRGILCLGFPISVCVIDVCAVI